MLKWRSRILDGRLVDDNGRIIPCNDAQDRIRRTIERTGRFILACVAEPPPIGSVSDFAGLPFRVVRYVTPAEAQADMQATKDIWETDGDVEWQDSFFEVEVAD